jgi:hypothetical protein
MFITRSYIHSSIHSWLAPSFKCVPRFSLPLLLIVLQGSVSESYNIPWPNFMQSLLNTCRLFVFDVIQVLAVDCVGSFNFYSSYLVVTGVSCAVLLLCFVMHRLGPSLLICMYPEDGKSRGRTLRQWLIKSTVVFMVCTSPFLFLYITTRRMLP